MYCTFCIGLGINGANFLGSLILIVRLPSNRGLTALKSRFQCQKKFGYGESNPELPRRIWGHYLRGGNVSRYTIPDSYLSIFKFIISSITLTEKMELAFGKKKWQKVSSLESTANLYGDPYVGYFRRTAERQFPRGFPVDGNPTNTIMRTCSMSNGRLPTMHFPLVAIACIGQE